MAWPMLAALAIQAGQGAAQYGASRQQYKAQQRANQINAKLIDQELTQSYADNMLQVMQELMSMKTALEDQQREYMKQKGTAITAAGEAGVAGNSVDLMLGDLAGQNARSQDRIRQQTEWNRSALMKERRALFNQARRSKAGLPLTSRPSLLGTALSTGASMTNTYMAYK